MCTFRTIHLPSADEFLACRVSTTVLSESVLGCDERNLKAIAGIVKEKGFRWAITNRDTNKKADWWEKVESMSVDFSWGRLHVCGPITAKAHAGSLEFGARKVDGKDFGGGCHRAIALAIAVLSGHVVYQPFDILLDCR